MYQRMRASLCRMIFTCELSPNLVDHDGFREFLRTWRAEMPLITSRQLNITVSNTLIVKNKLNFFAFWLLEIKTNIMFFLINLIEIIKLINNYYVLVCIYDYLTIF